MLYKLSKFRVPLLVLASVAMFVLSMPGLDFSGLAWFFLVPLSLYAMMCPAWKTWLKVSGAFCYLGGVLMLIWLRHLYPPLGWVAVFLLPLAYMLFPFIWMIFLRVLFPHCIGKNPFWFRALLLLGLAGLWVFLEWTLTWFLSGFPWMPLSATQWDFPAVLPLCRYAGPNAVSFMIVLFNLAVARYIWRQFVEVRRELVAGDVAEVFPPLRFLRSVCPEFYLALAPVFFSIVLFAFTCVDYDGNAEKKFTFAAVQTDFDPTAKWDNARQSECVNVVSTLIKSVPATADFVMLPEAALPFPVEKNSANGYDRFLEDLSRSVKKPILLGGIAPVAGNPDGYYNSVHVVDPRFGLVDEFAAKRHLVPFGEYVPLADIFPLRKVVPIAHDCVPATWAEPLRLRLGGRVVRAGVLVCYEDVFPELARTVSAKGADVLAVVTNDAWYGQEAGAYQHAAHSVLLAVSLGKPVIRCGNAGWSGTISPIGQIRKMADKNGSIYFRGVQAFDVYGWKNPQSTFYERHGNWLVSLGLSLFLVAFVACRRKLLVHINYSACNT